MTALLLGGVTAVVITWNVTVMAGLLLQFGRENRGVRTPEVQA
jgi:hypothetical protein